jgi:cell division protein FtsB
MTLAEKIVAALIMKDETIATLEAEVETLKAEAQELEKVRDYFDSDVPALVLPVQIDVPVNL